MNRVFICVLAVCTVMAVMGAEQESDKIDPQNHMTKLNKDEVAEKHEAEESEKEAHAEYTVDQDIAKADNRGGSLAKDLEVKLKQGIADCMELSLATNTEVGEAFCGTIDECGLEAQKASCKIWKKDVAAWEKKNEGNGIWRKTVEATCQSYEEGQGEEGEGQGQRSISAGNKGFSQS
jgi:Ni/Co efflux regulator RcnB